MDEKRKHTQARGTTGNKYRLLGASARGRQMGSQPTNESSILSAPTKKALRGVIRIASNHPAFTYEYVYGCEPKTNRPCDNCKYRFKCFTGEEIQFFFKGTKLGIFPKWWCKPLPEDAELEKFMWGKRRNLIQVREMPGRMNYVLLPQEK